jgi:nitric oxide reductase subunit B
MERWKWPFRYLMAVAFWNCVGAGLFGFLINPPIALYYMQGLNLTPLHGHTALFGVYGFLGLGFSLFCLRAAAPDHEWNDRWTGVSFWGLNIGLSLMVLLSLLPIGILQTMACIDHGLWWARSSDFLYQPLLMTLKWMRMPGDIIFAGSALILSLQFFRLVFASFTTRKESP